jgi:hypothetical protein
METEQKQENAETTPAVVVTETAAVAAVSADELSKVRELVLKAHPEVVPELVRGGSIDELIASVTPAQGAYQQIAERVRAGNTTVATTETTTVTTPVVPPVVPAGGTAVVVDPAVLGPTTKIALALAARKKR